MSRIRDRNRFRKVYPFSRARLAPPKNIPIRFIDSATAFSDTVSGDDYIIVVNSTAGGTITIPESSTFPAAGESFIIKDAGGNAATNSITVTPSGSDLIDGQSKYVIGKDNEVAIFIYHGGTSWGVY